MRPRLRRHAAATYHALVSATAYLVFQSPHSTFLADAVPLVLGDIYVGKNNGEIEHYSRSTGALVQTLDTTINDGIGGICFDSDWNLYATLFNNPDKLAVFDASGTLVTTTFINTAPDPSFFYKPEGCTVSALDEIYVGHVGSFTPFPADIRKYDRNGNLLQIFNVALTPVGLPGVNTGNGPTFLDLHCDGCTMYYTENGPTMRRYDVCMDNQISPPSFITHTQRYFDLRVLPNEDVLVADTEFFASSTSGVQHFDSTGTTNVHTFDAPTYFTGSHHKVCAVDLDYVDEDTFWTHPSTGVVDTLKRIQINSPYADVQTITTADDGSGALEVLNPHRCGCAEPPADMVSWWPFDEVNGTESADIAGGNEGTHMNGPVPDDGMVSESLRFDGTDDYVEVGDDPALNFPTWTFTIDFWIHPDTGEVRGTIVRKGIPLGPMPIHLSAPGYHIFYQLGHFFVFLRGVALSILLDISPPSTHHADPDVWTFVAITVDGPAQTIKLYINGVLAQITNPILFSSFGDPSNTEDLVIGGSDFFPPTPDHNFDGRLDELEFFSRVLSQTEIQSIYTAGTGGKCKDDIHPPWDEVFCLENSYIIVYIAICNYNINDATYELSFKSLPAGSSGFGGGCHVDGPTFFDDPLTPGLQYPPNKVVTVASGKCISEPIRIGKPVGLVTVDEVACYQAKIRNVQTGMVIRKNGSVQAKEGSCPTISMPIQVAYADNVGILIPGGPPRPVVLTVNELRNVEDENVTIVVTPYDSDMSGEIAPISIDGGREGVPYTTTVLLPGETTRQKNGVKSVDVKFTIETSVREPFGFHDLVVSIIPHDEYNCLLLLDRPLPPPVVSLGIRSPMLSETDLDGDGIRNEYEIQIGLDPYVFNDIDMVRPVLVKRYDVALSDAIGGAQMLTEVAALEPGGAGEGSREVAKFAKSVSEAKIKLDGGDVDGAVGMTESAMELLHHHRPKGKKRRHRRRRLKPSSKSHSSKHENNNPSTSNIVTPNEMRMHAMALTDAIVSFVDGMVQLAGVSKVLDVTKATEEVLNCRAAGRRGDMMGAVGGSRKVLKFLKEHKVV